jgi:hypothetical protein
MRCALRQVEWNPAREERISSKVNGLRYGTPKKRITRYVVRKCRSPVAPKL